MPYDQICLRILISGNCIFHLKMRVFWLSGPNGSPDKKLKHEGNVAHRTFRGDCVICLVLENYSSYQKIAMFSYKWVTLWWMVPGGGCFWRCFWRCLWRCLWGRLWGWWWWLGSFYLRLFRILNWSLGLFFMLCKLCSFSQWSVGTWQQKHTIFTIRT